MKAAAVGAGVALAVLLSRHRDSGFLPGVEEDDEGRPPAAGSAAAE